MKHLALALLVVALPALGQQDTSSLVAASKEAKAKRKSSTSKVITNKDVKKSKATLIELPPKELPAVTAEGDRPITMEQHDANRKAQKAADARVAAAEQAVKELEVELARVEQRYFEENDLNKRDRLIVQDFAAVKEKLAAARATLEAEKNGTNRTNGTDGTSSH